MATASKVDVTPLAPFDLVSDPTYKPALENMETSFRDVFGSFKHKRRHTETSFIVISSGRSMQHKKFLTR